MIQKLVIDVIQKESAEERAKVTGQGITGWRSSGLGTCMRGRFLNRLLSGTGIKPEFDPRTLSIFEMGNQIEDWLMSKLAKQTQYSVTQQIELYDPELNLSGHLDAYLFDESDYDSTHDVENGIHREYICECKSKNSASFKYMKDGAQVHHKMQLHSYLYMMRKYGGKVIDPVTGAVVKEIAPRGGLLRQGCILYISKDDMKMAEYPVFAEDAELEAMWKFEINTLNKCWEEKTAPPAPPAGSWQGKYCEFCKLGLCGDLTDAKVKELFAIKDQPIEESVAVITGENKRGIRVEYSHARLCWEVWFCDENGESILCRRETEEEASVMQNYYAGELALGHLLSPEV